MYLSHTLVLNSFVRLRENDASGRKGKAQLERTSSLMIALAYDITAKKLGRSTLDIAHAKCKTQTCVHRSMLIAEYSRLVSVSKAPNDIAQSVHELGFVVLGGKDPSQRISSNFMSTQVVKATISETEYEYPMRPAPLLYLGKKATGITYGVELHDNWQEGFKQHLSGVSSNTPFTDLAMFCLRYENAEKKETLTLTISAMIRQKFSKDIADFWVSKIKAERLFAKHLSCEDFMEEVLVDSLATINSNCQDRRAELMKYDKEQLVEMIIRSGGLTMNNQEMKI